MIDEANQSLEESGTPSHEIMVIVLHREFTAGSIGITLAGGADYESKDITVSKEFNKVIANLNTQNNETAIHYIKSRKFTNFRSIK